MRTTLTALFIALSLAVSAQTVVESMQTIDDEKTLKLNIVGKRNGRPFHHTLLFDVQDLTRTERDSLHKQTLNSLSELGISNVPGMKRFGTDERQQAPAPSGAVVLHCETCTGKGRIEIYAPGYTRTRSFNSRRDPKPFFPYTFHSTPGEYRLVYVQKGVRQIESKFTVSAGESTALKVK